MKDTTTTVQVKTSTKELLDKYGRKGETYDEIIVRAISEAHKK